MLWGSTVNEENFFIKKINQVIHEFTEHSAIFDACK